MGAIGARIGATKLRERDVQNLADFMRMGGEAQIAPKQTKISDLYKMYQSER